MVQTPESRNKTRMSFNCEKWGFQGLNAYPWMTFRCPDGSRLG